jgi:dihydropteroate synthase
MDNFSTSSGLFSRNFSLNLGGRIVDLDSPLVMGVINATPDSFHEDSRLPGPSDAVKVAARMLEEGAGILDVGGMSTRPGAGVIPEEEEVARLSPVVEAIRNEFPDCPISVDTWRSGVAKTIHSRFRIHMVNDISAGLMDPHMFRAVAELGVACVLMHMKGTPQNMQDDPRYEHVTDEILQFFGERVFNLRKMGVNDIVIDPGFGFGKTLDQNYQLLKELSAFAVLELPVMVGISRKSMIWKLLETDPADALNGTTSAHMAALMGGANILRVHDVKEAVETVKIFRQISKNY